MSDDLFLIDGNSLAYRAYFALPDLPSLNGFFYIYDVLHIAFLPSGSFSSFLFCF